VLLWGLPRIIQVEQVMKRLIHELPELRVRRIMLVSDPTLPATFIQEVDGRSFRAAGPRPIQTALTLVLRMHMLQWVDKNTGIILSRG